ncbi:MerR family transcriptional regulator [Salinibacterium soli]|uniref:MerR family transcriptional regulator n=1 Tax=Antiquaquibacter soli TaxID=3064523 RepID=A0ABT9BQU7_9MICO|nr:MerR family transcriptional regulator [Protaetiibacter sp. WY-16]MDO7883319.1 MerR family transcriptional regulator [Protaetiibacter sp. WY-16]
MRISELCDVSGVPLPSIKYYLREGLLPPGERTAANQADYGQQHVQRLKLVRALLEVGGLPVATAQRVIQAIDDDELPLTYVFGVAQYAISDGRVFDEVESGAGLETVDDLVDERGWTVSADNPGRFGAARVLDALDSLGHGHIAEYLPQYAEAAETIARADLATLGHHDDRADMAENVVVGTVLGDTLIQSLRRLAQENESNRRYPVGENQ